MMLVFPEQSQEPLPLRWREELLALPELSALTRRNENHAALLNATYRLLLILGFIVIPWWAYSIESADWTLIIGTKIVDAVVLFLAWRVGRLARRSGAPTIAERLRDDERQPVLLFRSFSLDTRRQRNNLFGKLFWLWFGNSRIPDLSYEESIVKPPCDQVGPLIAIGDPHDSMAQLGATRVYVVADRWSTLAETFVRNAAVVIFMIQGRSLTEGVALELAMTKRVLPLERVFMIHWPQEGASPAKPADVDRFLRESGLKDLTLERSKRPTVIRFEHGSPKAIAKAQWSLRRCFVKDLSEELFTALTWSGLQLERPPLWKHQIFINVVLGGIIVLIALLLLLDFLWF